MRIVQVTVFGGPEVLVTSQAPNPVAGPGQVVVGVSVVDILSLEVQLRSGWDAGYFSLSPPYVPGSGVGGQVISVGEGVDSAWIGRHVITGTGGGGYAEQAVAPVEELIPVPDGLGMREAVALLQISPAALRLVEVAGIKPGERVLVAAQLARAWGAEVVGTASPVHHAFLREVGVRPVTYGDGLAERVRAAAPEGVDAALDASGRGVLAVSIELTGDAEKVITIADGRAAEYGVRFSTGADRAPLSEVFAEVFPLLEWDALRLPIERTFPLGRAADAHRLSEEGHLLGKIVIMVA